MMQRQCGTNKSAAIDIHGHLKPMVIPESNFDEEAKGAVTHKGY